MEIVDVSTTEEGVCNPEYEGWQYARIEVTFSGDKFPREVGYIKVFKDSEVFDKVREALENICL